jgi:hypothetical protein
VSQLRPREPTIRKLAIVVANTFAKVDVTSLVVALGVGEGGTKNGSLTVALDAELDVL